MKQGSDYEIGGGERREIIKATRSNQMCLSCARMMFEGRERWCGKGEDCMKVLNLPLENNNNANNINASDGSHSHKATVYYDNKISAYEQTTDRSTEVRAHIFNRRAYAIP